MKNFINCFHFFIFDILFYSVRVYRSNGCNVKTGTIETLREAVILDFEKYYFNSIYTIPADKGILCAVKATLKIPLTKIKDNLMVWLLIDNKKK